MRVLELWPILLGWPAVILSLILSVIAILRARPTWLVIAAIIILPISLYLAGSAKFTGVALVLPLLLYGASIAIRRSRQWLAWALVAPVAASFGWIALLVINE